MQTRLMSRPRIASVPLGDQSQRRAITEHLVALRLRSLLVVYAVVAVGGCSDEEVVNVPEVASVEVFPTRQVFAVGRTAMFTAIRRDSLGQQFGGPDVSWTSSNENVAAVDFNHAHTRRIAAWWEEGHDLLITPTVPYDPPPAKGPFPEETEGKKQGPAGVARSMKRKFARLR